MKKFLNRVVADEVSFQRVKRVLARQNDFRKVFKCMIEDSFEMLVLDVNEMIFDKDEKLFASEERRDMNFFVEIKDMKAEKSFYYEVYDVQNCFYIVNEFLSVNLEID